MLVGVLVPDLLASSMVLWVNDAMERYWMAGAGW